MTYLDLPIPVPTTEGIQDTVAAMLVEGTGITLAYDDNLGTITISSGGGPSSINHNDTLSIQGGTTGQYNHLTNAELLTVQTINSKAIAYAIALG